jgi:uncharacterized sulfatase
VKKPNFVFIMTDTQNRSMVGAYGYPKADTPNLDRLAQSGIRFDAAYTTCPLCVPARAGIFSGTHPQYNGAWANSMAPSTAVPLMGTIFAGYGYRVGYTGKWHLDGSAYFGDGEAGGGFPQDWWYDGKLYAEDLGPELFKRYIDCNSVEDLRDAGFTDPEKIWGHRVADRALDFLDRAGDEPFLLTVSFDEPHRPCVSPPEYWERFTVDDLPKPGNFNAPLENKPELQRIHRRQLGERSWEETAEELIPLFGCNSYIDREIGRVVEAVEATHADDTVIIYTSDHGDMMGAHGLSTKGPMMYEDTCRIPLMVRAPGIAGGRSTDALISHLDIIPTMIEMMGQEPPGLLQGVSQLPVIEQKEKSVRDHSHIGFHRFALNHDNWGGLYPIRCTTDGRYKLSINLNGTDELYDLEQDPLELENRIEDSELSSIRDNLHDELLNEMDRCRDPFRSFNWAKRSWRVVRELFYFGGTRRIRPSTFPFQSDCIEADGTRCEAAKKRN